MLNFIKEEIQKARSVLQKIEEDAALLKIVQDITNQCVTTLLAKGRVFFAGNGGSAADAQHYAAELVSRLRYDRPGLSAIALTTDTSALTAIGNDYAYENVFSRQVESLGQKGDVFFGITTSGRSPNILKALEVARSKGMITVGLTGMYAPLMAERCDFVVNIPAKEVPKIQEGHLLLGHIICALIEEEIYGAEYNPARKKAEAEA